IAWRVLHQSSSARAASTSCLFFFFNDPAPTELYTLSLHDALPILKRSCRRVTEPPRGNQSCASPAGAKRNPRGRMPITVYGASRSEEHTSELQSQSNLVCRLLLEKKKNERQEQIIGSHTSVRSSAY